MIFKILLHCHCVLCFAQIVASNWVKSIIDFWSPIITIVNLFMAYFHFFIIERQMSKYMCQISCKNYHIGKMPSIFDTDAIFLGILSTCNIFRMEPGLLPRQSEAKSFGQSPLNERISILLQFFVFLGDFFGFLCQSNDLVSRLISPDFFF